MPINYVPTPVENVQSVNGIKLASVAAKIKNWSRDDVLLMVCEDGAVPAAVFTQNQFCAAPVLVDREHMQWMRQHQKSLRAVVVNAGNANAGTGASGLADARKTCDAVAAQLGCSPEEVLVCSTGVIMEPLPVDKIIAALPQAKDRLSDAPDAWVGAAKAIMTTDTIYKVASENVDLDGVAVTVTGIAKGAGMIHPNMATMLSFIACDVAIAANVWQNLWRDIVNVSFNAVTVDGDTSTNDTMIAMATGKATMMPITRDTDPRLLPLKEALMKVALTLAQALVRDGEGATKFIEIDVGGASFDVCKKVAFTIAHSPLIKTAFFASDPNLGRIVCGIGNALPQGFDVGNVSLWLNDVLVVERGGRAASYKEEDGQRTMAASEITVRIDLGTGVKDKATVWTCDLSHEYVTINAEYRT